MKTKFTFLLCCTLTLFYGQLPKTSVSLKTIDKNETTIRPDSLKKMISQIRKNDWEKQGLKGRVKSIIPYSFSEFSNDDGKSSYVGRHKGLVFDDHGNISIRHEFEYGKEAAYFSEYFKNTYNEDGHLVEQTGKGVNRSTGTQTSHLIKFYYKPFSIEIEENEVNPNEKLSVKKVFLFDTKGNLLQMKNFNSGKIDVVVKYNSFGKPISREAYNTKGGVDNKTIYTYNYKGNLISEKTYVGSAMEYKAFYTYDASDNLIEVKKYGNSLPEEMLGFTDAPDYSKPLNDEYENESLLPDVFPVGNRQKKGVKTIYYFYDIKGVPESETRYTYDNTGNLIARDYYPLKYGSYSNTTYEYNNKGNLSKKLTFGKEVNQKVEYSYDDRANLVETKTTDSNGDTYINSQKYDHYGNIIEVNWGDNIKYKYKIRYYE